MLSWRVTKRQSNRSKRKGNTLGLGGLGFAFGDARMPRPMGSSPVPFALLFAAVLAGLGVLYVVLFTNL